MRHSTFRESSQRSAGHFSPGTGQNRRTSGFTIIEVAMASFVMAFGIATSLLAMQSGFKALDVARDTTVASQILQSEMERLRLLPWNNTSTTAKDSIVELIGKEEVNMASMFSASAKFTEKFRVVRVVEKDSDTTRENEVCYITIIVSWNSYDGRSHTRSFRSMYAKNGLYDYYYTIAH